MKKSKKINSKNNTISFETFRKIGSYTIDNLKQEKADCFNGLVSIKKYKVTIELIEEPKDVLSERLQELWDLCNNIHHWNTLKQSAKEIGYELIGKPGNKLKKSSTK